MTGEFPHQENKGIYIEFWNNGNALGLKCIILQVLKIWVLECVLFL